MVSFDEVYWYINTCPLRKLRRQVFPDLPRTVRLAKKLAHDALITIMTGELSTDKALAYLINRVRTESELKSSSSYRKSGGYSNELSTLLYSIVWAGDSWNSYTGIKKSDIIDKNITIHTNGMEARVDIIRFKRTPSMSYINLTWIDYGIDVPTEEYKAKLFQYVQYNARAYELLSNTRPTQLDVFFPFLNHTFHFLYNPESAYEVVAKLIDSDIYYAIPSPICNTCTACPASWDLTGRERVLRSISFASSNVKRELLSSNNLDIAEDKDDQI